MVNLERAIYSIVYYWHGMPKRGVPSIIWLFDKLHQLEWYTWSKLGNLPYNQEITDKIEEMIVSGDLSVSNNWSKRYGNVGLIPIQNDTSPKLYTSNEKFNKEFRMVIKYYIRNQSEFKQLFLDHENTPINIKNFYNTIMDKIRLEVRMLKIAV